MEPNMAILQAGQRRHVLLLEMLAVVVIQEVQVLGVSGQGLRPHAPVSSKACDRLHRQAPVDWRAVGDDHLRFRARPALAARRIRRYSLRSRKIG